jgi:hypothetical protein
MKQQSWFASRGAALCLAGAAGVLISCASPSRPREWGACEGQTVDDGAMDLRVRVHRVRGRVTLNGAPLAPSSAWRLELESHDGRTNATVSGQSLVDGRFEATLPAGAYRVRFVDGRVGSTGALTLLSGVVRESIEVRDDSDVTVDVRTVRRDFSLRINGVVSRAAYVVELTDPRGERSIAIRASELETLGVEHVVSGTYRLALESPLGCDPRGELPCGRIELGERRFEESGAEVIDLRTARASLAVTGAPSSLWSAALELRSERASVRLPPLSAGPLSSLTVFADRYEVRAREHLANADRALARDVDFTRSREAALPVRKASITQLLRLDGRPLAAGPDASLVFFDREGRRLAERPLPRTGERVAVPQMEASVALFIASGCGWQRPCGAVMLRPFAMIDRDFTLDGAIDAACIPIAVTVDGAPMDEPSFGSLVVKSALDVSASAPFAMSVAREGGVVHVLPGDYALRAPEGSCSDARSMLCGGRTLRASIDGRRSISTVVALRTARARGSVTFVDATTERPVDVGPATLRWIDDVGARRESDARAFSLAVARAPHVVELSMGCSGAATACVTTRVFGCGG